MGELVQFPVRHEDHSGILEWNDRCDFLHATGWEWSLTPIGKSIIRVWKEPSGILTGKYGTQLAYDLARGGGPEGLRSLLDNGT